METWPLESHARDYTQKSDRGQNSTRFSPSMKLVHQWVAVCPLRARSATVSSRILESLQVRTGGNIPISGCAGIIDS